MTEWLPRCSEVPVLSSPRDQTTAATAAPDAAPSSPARDALSRVISGLEIALQELDEAHKPARQLSAAVAETAAAERELAEFRGRDDTALATWLTEGAEGPRPDPSPATREAERRVARANRDGAAARTALPAVEARVQSLAERVRALHRERDDAAYQAAVDAGRAFARRWHSKLVDALRDEATLRSLHSELATIGNLGDGATAALAAARAIADLINETRRSAAVPHDQESGRRLIAALMTDPGAVL